MQLQLEDQRGQKESTMFKSIQIFGVVLFGSLAQVALAQDSSVTPLLQQSLDISGKEAVMLQVDLPPGGEDPAHRHDSTVLVYVLSGSVVMQVEGEEEVTLGVGDTFQEEPDDVHLVGRNASMTEPASFLAFFVKDEGTAFVLPAK